jgi:hypothetical protein
MEKKRIYYTGAGLAIGTGIGGAIGIIIFSITGNSVFIAISGIGTALGLIFGAALDARNGKNTDEKKG